MGFYFRAKPKNGVRNSLTCLTLLSGLFSFDGAAETIRLAASTPLSSFADPLALDLGNGIIPSVFDGLTRVGANGIVFPALALSWTATSDTTWTFQLRPETTFHDGTPFDAETAVEFLTFLSAPDSLVFPIAAEAASIAGVRQLDPLTIEITTHQADPILDRKLSRIKMIPLSVWKEKGRTAFSRQPVGTGPYSIAEWDRAGASGVVMKAAVNSWRAPQQIDRVEYIILPDAPSRIQSLFTGEADIASAIDPDTIPVLEAAGYKVHIQPGPIVQSIAFHNCGNTTSPVNDHRVRLALNLAVDKQRIVKQLLGGATQAATQGGLQGVFGHNPDIEPYPFDPDTARSLLAEAGYGDGMQLVMGLFTGQYPSDALVYQQVAQDWGAIGAEVELRRFTYPEFIRRSATADWDGFDAFTAAWNHYEYGEVGRSLKRFAGVHPGPYFCAPELLNDIAASEQEMDDKAREKMLRDLMARLNNLVPSLPLVHYVSINGLSPRVLEFKSETDAILFGEMRVASE